MHEANAQALHVVARELASTLNDVRATLEATAERPGDVTQLARTAELLGQARGVLRVVEVYGGALLAEEMEHTARFMLRGGDARQHADGLDALMRSVVQLPTYLERVLSGGRDLALVLLPLLNDLRSVRGAPLLSEGTLLSLNLKSDQQPQPRKVAPGEPGLSLGQWARRLRPRFQVALLGLIRGEHPAENMDGLAEVAARIESVATTGPAYQLWWVVGAVLEALKAGGLDDNASVKRLLGQADRELRRLYELGEERYSDQPPLELLNNLLFYVARASTDGPRVAAVRSSFRLTELLPVDESVEQERESLSAPSVKLMHTVAAAIREDLGRVKDALDLFTRKGGQAEELGPQVDLLKKIGDTLAVLGLGSLREQVQAELGKLADVVARRVPTDSESLVGIAAALIRVEDSLDESLVKLIMPPGVPVAGLGQDPEFKQVAEAVLRECSVNLARIKELVAQALEPDADIVSLDSVAPLARGVTAGLLMLGKTRATEIMGRIAAQVAGALEPGEGRPPPGVIDRLADAVVSVEYYMETLQAGRGDPWYMLDNAERCLAAVETGLGAGLPALDEATAAATVAIEPPPAVAAPPPAEQPAPPAEPAAAEEAPAAMPPAIAQQPDPELLAVFIEEAREEAAAIRSSFPMWAQNPSDRESLVRLRRAFHTLKGSGRMVGATTMGEFAWSIEDLLNRVIDGTRLRSPEMMTVFREAVAAVPTLVDALEAGESPDDTVGGLMARAHAIAEGREPPAGRRPAEPAYEPTEMLPALDEATMARMLETVPPVEADAPPVPEAQPPAAADGTGPPPGEMPAGEERPPEAVVSAAVPPSSEPTDMPSALPGPEREPEPAAAYAGAPEREAEHEEPEPEAELEGEFVEAMDPSLQDIYRREVQSHLDVLRDFLRRAWTSPGPHYVTEDLYRACHTLRGASRTAESRHSIRLADPLHRWLRRLFDHDRPFEDEGLAVLADTVSAFEDVLDHINEDSGFFVNLNEVIGRLSALDLALEQALSAATLEPEAAEPEEAAAAPTEAPAAGVEPTAPPEPFRIDHLIPAISLGSGEVRGRPGAGYDKLLPPLPEEPGVTGEVPYLELPAEGGAAPEDEPTPTEKFEPAPESTLPAVVDEVARAEAEAAAGLAGPEAPVEESAPTEPDSLAPEPVEPDLAAPERVEPDFAAPEPVEPDLAGFEAPEPVELEPMQPEPAAPGPAEPSVPEAEVAPVATSETESAAPELPEEFEPTVDVDYDADIAAIFCEEATELLEASDVALGALRAERGSRERVVELQRALHTLKGGARMAGIRAMGDLSHELESFLIQVSGGTVPLEDRSFEVVQASLDELNRMRDFVNAGRPVTPARDLITRIRLVASGATPVPVVERGTTVPPDIQPRQPAGIAAGPPAEPEPEARAEPTGEAPAPATGETPATGAEPIAPPAAPATPAEAPPLPGRELAGERAELARVDADLLDSMLNNAGEVSIFRSRLEQQLSSVEFNLAELGRVVQRLKEQLRKLEMETEAQILHRHEERSPRREDFDPLELDRYSSIQQYSRALAETASDVGSVQGLLESLTREAQNLLQQQGRVVSDLQNGLMRTRMVPFQRHVQRLTRIVRQVAAESGKRADLTVTGAAGELDRQVLERMLPPFEHLLRNAVVHGIESPAERAARGKPATGRIELALKREGSEVVITVSDDGAGINLRAVRDKAVGLGIASPRQELSDEQAMQLILEPGFTTAGKVTQTAGRGVGMDVVATEIKKLGGALFIESEEGRGTTFIARLPFTLAISQALVVRAGEEFFALPLPTVEGVVRVPAAEVRRLLAEDAAGFEYGGQRYRFRHLADFVSGEASPPAEHDPAVPVILVRAGEHSTGIVTDELVGSREIVVKSIGPQIAGIRGISGATILGDGRICIILDVGALVRSDWRGRPAAESQAQAKAREQADRRVFALVVDDSITVRRVTQRLLERNGMRVMTAKDGLDAVGVLQDQVPDVILLDIEMPRMDGYEVASHVRNDPRLKDVPIVMITSRVGEKHRARAIELGVNDYLGKPYQETELLQALEPLLRQRRVS